jgi:hypothetical protein
MKTIQALRDVVTGDGRISSYMSGPDLVELFNNYGAEDSYGQGFPARWKYAEDNLRRLNGKTEMAALIQDVLDPRRFIGTDFDQKGVVDHLNQYLSFDGYEISLSGKLPKIRDVEGLAVEFQNPFTGSDKDGHVFVEEQLKKCSKKFQEGDYDGAITNARSMLEAILREIDFELSGKKEPYSGDLLKLYRRVAKQLNIEPSRPDLDSTMKQVLSGMISVVNGLACMSNTMGDRHARKYKPEKRHAALAINATNTIARFLIEVKGYRKTEKSDLAALFDVTGNKVID